MTESTQEHKKDEHGRDEVQIFMDTNAVPFWIHRGNQSVVTIKHICGVEDTWVIEILRAGKFEPLANDGHIVIKGGERFISHVAGGGSS
jgi:hypothetical protein